MKDQNKFFTYFIVLLSLLVIVCGGYFVVQAANSIERGSKSQINKEDEYPLRKNATEYQQEIHKDLLLSIKNKPIDKELVSELVAKNFIADFFTWTNKLQFNDVGGLQFINEDYRKSVYDKSLDTFYHDLQFYLEDDTVEETLEVTRVWSEAKVEEIEMDEQEVMAYVVETSWEYEMSEILNTDDYQSKTYITVIEDSEGRFSVVEVNTNEEQED